MIVGISHFSLTTGRHLIAEGVETKEEARTLSELGVEFGQGYFFGRPGRVEKWAAAAVAGKPHGPARNTNRASARRGSSQPGPAPVLSDLKSL
jgi:predicted signal transduction protein with EAL and GGDEF domain